MAVGFTWTDFQPEPSILDPFRTIFDVLGPTWKSGLGQNMAWRAKTRPGPPSQACRFRNFFLGPIPELFSARFSPHFQEIRKIMSNPLTRHYFSHFQEMHEILSAQTQTWHSWTKNLQKKVPEWGPEKSSGIGRPGWGFQAKFWPSPDFQVGPRPSFGPALIFKSDQKLKR